MSVGSDQHREPRALQGQWIAVHFAVLALAIGYTTMVAIHKPPLAGMADGALLTTPQRVQLFQTLAIGTLAASLLMAAFLRWTRRRGQWPASLAELVSGLWPLTLLPIALYVFDVQAWLSSPVLLYAISTAACVYCVIRTEWPPEQRTTRVESALRRHAPVLTLGLAITLYVVYVSAHTMINHRSLGTAAYDLGLQENVLWNSLHGDLLHSSVMNTHYLGVHASFVLLLILPVYALFPAAETLLVIQTLAIGFAALPLYFLACRVLASTSQALVIACLWLSHPAVGGANFYDFHSTAFVPLVLFTALTFWHGRRWLPFWISIALLLTIKEDLSIVVVLLGALTLNRGDRRQGWLLMAAGAAAYIALQHGVIPHFAGRDHSYAWYYTEMIPYGEGPRGLVTTALLNPVFAIKVALSQPKVLYLFQLFAPLAFLPFLTGRGCLFMSYGLAAAFLASRPSLTHLGFHYALNLLVLAFFAALLALRRIPPCWRTRALTAAILLAVVTCFQYGMIWPRHNFTGGFQRVDFNFSETDRDRYEELLEMIAQIPDEASVLASENLVPHIARRRIIGTERYVNTRRALTYDIIFVHDDDWVDRLRELPAFDNLDAYEIIDRSEHFVLLGRRR